MHSNDEILTHLKENIVYKCSCPEENCNLSYIGESSRCLENRVKEHNSHITGTIYQHSVSNNNPRANLSLFKLIANDSKQVARETREAIYIRNINPALNCNTGKMYIPEIFNNLLGADENTNESNQMGDSNQPKGHIHLTIPSDRFSSTVCFTN